MFPSNGLLLGNIGAMLPSNGLLLGKTVAMFPSNVGQLDPKTGTRCDIPRKHPGARRRPSD